MHSIKHLFHINTPIEAVFNNITTIEGLKRWRTTEITGSDELSGVIQFRFNGVGPDIKVTGLKRNEEVS
jgi:uncharacterized protein YndB with AHSA1/START domain